MANYTVTVNQDGRLLEILRDTNKTLKSINKNLKALVRLNEPKELAIWAEGAEAETEDEEDEESEDGEAPF